MFQNYTEKGKKYDGEVYIWKFANYGVDVVRHFFSYGGAEGLWEAAILKKDSKGDFDLCYDTPMTDDVIGWLSEDDVNWLVSVVKRYDQNPEDFDVEGYRSELNRREIY